MLLGAADAQVDALNHKGQTMPQKRAILKKKKTTQSIRKITRALAAIAGGNLLKLRKRMLGAEPYARVLREMTEALFATVGDIQHPLLRRPAIARAACCSALLVITSDRGLVGAYNNNVLRMASEFIRAREAEEKAVELYVAGKKGIAYFRSHGRPLAKWCDQSRGLPSLAQMEETAASFIDQFTSGRFDSIQVAYTIHAGTTVHQPTLRVLLPMEAETGAATEGGAPPYGSSGKTVGAGMYDCSPAGSLLLDELLPLMFRIHLQECFLHAITSENAARRLVTMRATANADRMSKALTMQYNRARQEHITSELLDIIGASEAIRKSADA